MFRPSAEKTDVILSASVAFDEGSLARQPSVSPVSPRQRPSALSLCDYSAARLSWISATFTDAWKLQQETCEARYACDYIGAGGRDRGRY